MIISDFQIDQVRTKFLYPLSRFSPQLLRAFMLTLNIFTCKCFIRSKSNDKMIEVNRYYYWCVQWIKTWFWKKRERDQLLKKTQLEAFLYVNLQQFLEIMVSFYKICWASSQIRSKTYTLSINLQWTICFLISFLTKFCLHFQS